jgi:hypothetical protein
MANFPEASIKIRTGFLETPKVQAKLAQTGVPERM